MKVKLVVSGRSSRVLHANLANNRKDKGVSKQQKNKLGRESK